MDKEQIIDIPTKLLLPITQGHDFGRPMPATEGIECGSVLDNEINIWILLCHCKPNSRCHGCVVYIRINNSLATKTIDGYFILPTVIHRHVYYSPA